MYYNLQKTKFKCQTCGKVDEYVNPLMLLCQHCWEIEHRLDDYLKSDKGRAFVADRLSLAEKVA